MKKRFVIHPFLFAVFPVLALYAHNMHMLSFSVTLVPLGVALGSTLTLLLLLWLVLRDSKKAAIIVSVFAVLFFSYGHGLDVIARLHLPLYQRGLLVIWGILLALIAYLVIRTRRDLTRPTLILNVVAAVLVLIPSISIVAHELKGPSSFVEDGDLAIHIDSGETHTLRDIYYIILDSYASSTILKELHDFDNQAFTDYLTQKGFYIASQSLSNYASTSLSLASSLNMEYINYLSDVVGTESQDMTIPHEMIKNNRVMKFLRSKGYEAVHFETWFGATEYNEYADLNVETARTRMTEFERLLIQTTVLDYFAIVKENLTQQYRAYVLGAFDKLAEMPERKGPKFVFAHILCPRNPFVFGADGEPIDFVPVVTEEQSVNIEKWLNQVRFVNKKVEVMVDELLSKSEIPPIIILQADHGSRTAPWPTDAESKRVWYRVNMRIFNAYYLPEGGNDLLYTSITPVNTFRLIFNFYFGANLELLSDDSYYSFVLVKPYEFVDVTEEVKYD